MWHHRSVFGPFFSRLGVAAGALLLVHPIMAQAQRQTRAKAAVPSARPKAPNPTAELDAAIRTETAAVEGGDPATIAGAARSLNAQVLGVMAQLRLSQGKPQEAIALYRRSLELEPSTERRLEFASALLRSGHAAEALTETDPILASEPDNAAAWLTRGSALRDVGREKEAVTALTRAMQLRPQADIAFALGSTLLALHDPAGAAKIFGEILASSGQSAISEIAIGDAYRDAGYMDEAVSHFKAGLARDPRVAHGEFFLGLTYLQMNQWGPNSDSFQHLRKAALLDPHDYVSNFYLGALESTDGSDLPSSDRHLHIAAVADPSQAEVWLYLGLNANREKNTAAAKTYLRRAIDLTGDNESRNNYQVRRAYISLGRLLIAEGNRTEGEALLARYKRAEQAAVAESAKSIAASAKPGDGEQAASLLSSAAASVDARIKPETAPAVNPALLEAQASVEAKLRGLLGSTYNDLGTAEARQQQYGAALHDFQQGEQWDGSNPVLLRNLGTAAFRVNDSAEAARALSLLQAKQTAAGAALDQRSGLMLAMAQFSLGQFAEAAKSFKPVEPLALADGRAAYSYAFSLARTGDAQHANAIADRLSATALPSDVLSLVCHIYLDTENYEASNRCYRKAYTQDPQLTMAHYQAGESLIRLDRPAEAIPELRQELTLSPGEPNVQSALAFALLQTSHKDEAQTLLEAVTGAHPEHAEGQYQYGKLLLEQGRVPEAVAHLELAERADSTKDYVHYQLGTAYRKAGRAAEAERELRTYREIKDHNRDAHALPH